MNKFIKELKELFQNNCEYFGYFGGCFEYKQQNGFVFIFIENFLKPSNISQLLHYSKYKYVLKHLKV